MSYKIKEFIVPVITLVVIASVSAFMLGYVHDVTFNAIQKAKDNHELQAISEVVNEFDNDPFAEKTTIMTKDKKDKLIMYPARKGGKLTSVAIKSYTNTGFGGRIEVMTGFNVAGSIKTFKVISSNETPGLGSKVDDPKFKNQLTDFYPHRQILKVKQDGGDIDAVTAATISSRAVLRAIERAYDAFTNFNSGGDNE
ncbi:MAG: RnfABCDGE type electron transport complex subunit G [Alphaproteobacteria bacterium]|nr:RnfABCDGE type electron transport complex subunit G [Alphaproteobacteria bacterium]